MNVEEFIEEIRADPAYADQIVHVHRVEPRPAMFADHPPEVAPPVRAALASRGIERLYSHQAEAIRAAAEGRDVLVATGTASGKTLCYAVPLLEALIADAEATSLLLFPTKALCQDQFRGFESTLGAAGLAARMAGVYDGDTPSPLRRRLRDNASVVFSNPDMVHAALMAEHARWARFLTHLKLLVLDELHVYNGIFGSNMALVLRRFLRLCRNYGSEPQIIACSATIANPGELARRLTARDMALVHRDGSPSGGKTYVLWNPPRIRARDWRSRRSANVEAHELMAKLIERGVPTITFSKAKMTAEMIHRYVCETLARTRPARVAKVTPYRGGYLPEQRREIERRLFDGELLGVSTTRALELGIDVGCLEACVIVGYPGTLASFFQQAGRAGRTDEESLVVLVGLDTSVNQFVMSSPEYLFDRCVEHAVIDFENPFVAIGHLRCAAFEMPLSEAEEPLFGPHARLALNILEENRKLKNINNKWYYASSEVPNHEVSLRDYADANVVIEDVDTGAVLGEVNEFDAEPIIHPGAVYIHRGDTYLILDLDLDRRIARAKREQLHYYTQPLGGTDIHHIDQRLREKPFGTGTACWGEATAYFKTYAYEKINFYELDSFAVDGLSLPTLVLETMAVWMVPPENLLEEVRRSGLDPHSGLRGIGYATRMLLPMFVTCDTLDFSHTVGSANSPWQAVFIYERYPHGLGFTEQVYERLHEILPRVLETVTNCPCADGCPCCVGKPLRQYATWDVQRGEASIPLKKPTIRILEGYLGDRTALRHDDLEHLSQTDEARQFRLERDLRRRLERMREPRVFHPITPEPQVDTRYPNAESPATLATPDVAERKERKRSFDRDLHKRIAKKIAVDKLPALGGPNGEKSLEVGDPGDRVVGPSTKGMKSSLKPTDFPGRPDPQDQQAPQESSKSATPYPAGSSSLLVMGDRLARIARKRTKKQDSAVPNWHGAESPDNSSPPLSRKV